MFFVETKSTDPFYNLAFEEYILLNKCESEWLLLWQNDKTVVVGLNQNTAEEIDSDFVEKHGINVVRRMTGGGAVYHDLGNLNYSFIADSNGDGIAEAKRFNAAVCEALERFGLAAAATGRNDICVEGKKISGTAQRIYKNRILHHGTLLFDSDLEMVSGALKPDPCKFASKAAKSVKSRVANIKDFLHSDYAIGDFAQNIKNTLANGCAVETVLDANDYNCITALADEKYRSWEWNYGKSPKSSYHNKAYFSAGILEVYLDIEKGLIKSASFFGDYLATKTNDCLVRALCSCRYDKREVNDVLSQFAIEEIFGGISKEEVLGVMFR